MKRGDKGQCKDISARVHFVNENYDEKICMLGTFFQ